MTPAQRRELTDRQHRHLSIVRQCQLMGVSRSSLYYCQWRRHVGPLWRRESVPPRVIGQRKGPRQLFRENVARTAEAADRVGN